MLFNSIRIQEIAKKANVSTATVSRMINHPEAVSEETKKIIEKAMEELGVSNESSNNFSKAKNKAKEISHSNIVIVNLPNIGNPFFCDVLKGIESSATSHGLSVLVYTRLINSYTLPDILKMIETTHAIGIISLVKISTNALKILTDVITVVQCCEYEEAFITSYVGIDDISASKNATEYIISTGHKKIAFINAAARYKFAKHRYEGFISAINEADIAIPNNWIINLPNIEYDTALASITQILSSDNVPDAIFAVSDVYAIAALNVARDLHFRVPEDIIIVGFDDVNISLMSYPTLTTVSQPRYQIGYTAGEMLFEKINNPEQPVRNILFNTVLIVRGSSAAGNSTSTVVKKSNQA